MLMRADLDEFVNCYFGGKSGVSDPGYSGNRHERKESGRFKSFTYKTPERDTIHTHRD
jgi:hypothetical protein